MSSQTNDGKHLLEEHCFRQSLKETIIRLDAHPEERDEIISEFIKGIDSEEKQQCMREAMDFVNGERKKRETKKTELEPGMIEEMVKGARERLRRDGEIFKEKESAMNERLDEMLRKLDEASDKLEGVL